MTTLKRPHSDFRLEMISPIDVRAVGLDQLVTQLWLRVLLKNLPPARRTRDYATIAELAQEIEREGNERFEGFDVAPDATEAWLRADLVRPLKRDPAKYTVARPVHANAVRLRSSNRQADDSNASEAAYSWLWHADKSLLEELRSLIATPIDTATADLVTLALVHLGDDQEPDRPAKSDDEPATPPKPLSISHARIYAEDVRRLLAYRDAIPRPSLIAHLRRLTGFHLGLYLLKVFEIVTTVDSTGIPPPADPDLQLVVDFGEDPRSPMARLAESSWQRREQVLQRYVRAHLGLKKLHQYAERAHKLRRTPIPESLQELAELERAAPQERLEAHFDAELESMIRDNEKDSAEELDTLAREYRDMGMSPFRVYHAIIVRLKGNSWVGYHRQLLDYLLSKNTSEGLLRQPLGGRSRRRAAMGAALLETCTLVALVREFEDAFTTRPLRVDELISELETRYGLRIASAPDDLANDFQTARTLASNEARFKARLRETGLFRDLSDAFVAQLVRPRFTIE